MTAAKTEQIETVEISKEELEKLRREAADAEKYRPFKDVSGQWFDGPQDVIDFHTKRKMRDLAADELADINKVRLRQGFDRVKWETPEEEEQAILEKATEMAQDRKRYVPQEGGVRRTLKMVNGYGTIIQVPVEDQINNQAGSLGDGVTRYKNKGFKIAVDGGGRIICPAENCWDFAHGEAGQYTYGGYCSEAHRLMVEPKRVGTVDNVITAGALRV